MTEKIEATRRYIADQTGGFAPRAGIILGTGLGGLVSEIEAAFILPYAGIPHFPVSTVEGHSGNLLFGSLSGQPVVAMQGRFHFYEGYSMQELTFPVRVMKALGVEILVVSNASGGVNPDFEIGDIMIIDDHINLFPTNPLIGIHQPSLGPRFLDMSAAYDRDLIARAQAIASAHGIKVRKGCYAGLTGPCFETPAEYRYVRSIKADAVGMSTVPEVIVARHSGMRVFGISVITDLGVEGRIVEVSHEEVLHFAAAAAPKMSLLVRELLSDI